MLIYTTPQLKPLMLPMHEGVDLQLRLIEGVLGGGHHVRVDDLAHPRVQRHLRRMYELGDQYKSL